MVRTNNCDLEWVEVHEGKIPNGALQGGLDAHNEPIFIGRFYIETTFVSVGAVRNGME